MQKCRKKWRATSGKVQGRIGECCECALGYRSGVRGRNEKGQRRNAERIRRGVTLIITIIEFFPSKGCVLRRRFRNDEITIRNQRAEKTQLLHVLIVFTANPILKVCGKKESVDMR